jgi:F0F1-type ATP synthase assembly protein I
MDNNQENTKKVWWRDSLLIFARVSIWIALPVIIALFVGRALDSHFNTKPWLFLASIAVAFFISCFGIVKTMSREVKKMEKK